MDVATKTRSPAGQPGSVKAQLAVGAKLVDAGEVLTLRSRVALPAGGRPRPRSGMQRGDWMTVAFDQTVLKMVESEVRTIKAEYRGLLSEESIDALADQSLERLAGSRVPQFVPLFVGRFTRDRIKQLVQLDSRPSRTN